MGTRVVTVGSPCCPNHKVPMMRTGDLKKWQCPISQALFDVEVAEGEVEYDKYGNPMKVYNVGGSD